MLRIPHLETFLGAAVCFKPKAPAGLDAVAGWGYKNTSDTARSLARQWNVPYLAVEDGFLRSLGLGVTGCPPLSLVVDSVGMYYNCSRPSSLEEDLLEANFSQTERERARTAIASLITHRLSKYNHAPDPPRLFPDDGRKRVLLLDQTRNDVSVRLGGASAATFDDMLAAALHEYPDAHLAIKTHPDVLAGKKRGYLNKKDADRAQIISADCNPIALLQQVDSVFTVSSQMGFEALLLGKQVHCFGLPFYAGWGLTADRQSCPRRNKARTLEDLFIAAYMRYPRYIDPYTGRRCEIETVIDILGDQKRHNDRTRGLWVCAGFSGWRRGFARRFLQSTDGGFYCKQSVAAAAGKAAELGAKVLTWTPKAPPGIEKACAASGVPRVNMEDGFLRSSGLGSAFHWPYSLSLDTVGIYYDPTSPSELELLLENAPFPPQLLARAAALRRALAASGVTKYNVGEKAAPPAFAAGGAPVILVIGQVENDASVKRGGMGIFSDSALLQAVRQKNPGAFIVYKPHPDVVSGARRGGILHRNKGELFDQVVTEFSLAALFPHIDALHTLTSLSGFEALLRGIPVFTYGGPFYAGWGLTTDRVTFPRRTRQLTLDALVAATLILYPLYYDWKTNTPCGPEVVLERLKQKYTPKQGALVRLQCRIFNRIAHAFGGIRRQKSL